MHRNFNESNGGHQKRQLTWLPHPHLPGIYYHKLYQQQVQMHRITLPRSEVEVESGYIEGRINNQHPSICCLYLYQRPHMENAQLKGQNNDHLVVFTDRVLDLEMGDWTQENILDGVIGLKRLVMTYGPFQTVETLFGKNQLGEIKVWVSDKPYKNKPDFPVSHELETVNSLLNQVIKRHNPSLMTILTDSQSLREVIERLKTQRTFQSKRGHKYSSSISMHVIEEKGMNFEQSLYQNYGRKHNNRLLHPPRAKSSSPGKLYSTFLNSRQRLNHQPQQNNYNAKLSHRSQSNFNSPMLSSALGSFSPTVDQFQLQLSRFPTWKTQGSPFPSSPQSRRGTGSKLIPSSSKQSRVDYQSGITIINNNVNNFYHQPSSTRVSREGNRAKVIKIKKRPQFSSNSVHFPAYQPQPFPPEFIPSRDKINSLHSPPFKSNCSATRLLNSHHNKQQSEHYPTTHQRKDKKIFTFCRSNQQQHTSTQILTPKVSFQEVERPLTNYFPSAKSVLKEKGEEGSGKEFRQKVEAVHSKAKGIHFKAELQREYSSLLRDDQSRTNKAEAEEKELIKDSILKQKIKKKQQAFAQLKKDALKVLID